MYLFTKQKQSSDFPGGPEVKNPPANAGDVGSDRGPGGSTCHGQLSPCITITEPRVL